MDFPLDIHCRDRKASPSTRSHFSSLVSGVGRTRDAFGHVQPPVAAKLLPEHCIHQRVSSMPLCGAYALSSPLPTGRCIHLTSTGLRSAPNSTSCTPSCSTNLSTMDGQWEFHPLWQLAAASLYAYVT